jgi:hypothetical protein
MLQCSIIICPAGTISVSSKAGHLARLRDRRISMKNLILAAFAALSLSAAVAPLANAAVFHNGSTVAGDAANTRFQQTGAI